MSARAAIDIGGTFTDVVLEAQGEISTHKLLTTPDDPSTAALEGLERILADTGVAPDELSLVIHGTTLATNAIIERKGARTALLTTEGHRDVVEIALENRFEQYDVNIDKPEPFVAREFRFPIRERMNYRGNVLRALDMQTVHSAIEQIKCHGIESVAVGFLHSYANGSHEAQVRAAVLHQLPGMPISLSSEVCPEIREYERLSTTTANAYILPMMSRYLERLRQDLRSLRVGCPILMMTSGGGLTTVETASAFPVRLIESGPAGGAIHAAEVARRLGLRRVLSFDMGGTTAKLCTVDDAQPETSRSFEVDRRYRFKKGSGLPVRIPVIEMVEIGAGGGSVAWIDRMGRLSVGPESAGSSPGPACYGRGGTLPTVTDADALRGKLDPLNFAEGSIALNVAAAAKSMSKHVARHLDSNLDEACLGVSGIVDENMASAARRHAAEMGTDPNGRTLIAFGGAAPLHAADLVKKLDLEAAVVPAHAGVGSAVGFLKARVQFEVVASRYALLSEIETAQIERVFDLMRGEATEVVRSATTASLTEVAQAYMRYVGQGYEVPVTVDPRACTKQALQAAFDAAYAEQYGRLLESAEIEIMSWTLTVFAESARGAVTPSIRRVKDFKGDCKLVRMLEDSGWTEASQIQRADLASGDRVAGPALIVEGQTTTVVPSGFLADVNPDHDLVLSRQSPAG